MPALNSIRDMRVTVERVGRRRTPVLVVDHLFRDPAAVRCGALRRRFSTGRGAYPGYEAAAGWDAGPLLRTLGRLGGWTLDPHRCRLSFSIVTKRGRDLAPWQRTPHFDPVDVAGVVYLNLPEQCRGGTAFYRHRASGLEAFPWRVGRRLARLMRRHGLSSPDDLARWVMSPPKEPLGGFITASTEQWELLHLVAMRYNRLVVYHGRAFHSGYIEDAWFGPTLPTRRLTLNLFGALTRPA
jgi:hypothetical protein